MRRLSEEEAQDVNTDPPSEEEQGGPQAATAEAPAQPTRTDGTEQGEGENSMFPDGVTVMEGEVPESMIGPQPSGQPDEGEGQEGEQGGEPEASGEEGAEPEEGEQAEEAKQADDVATSATVEKVRKQAGLNVEDEDELVDTVKDMRRDLEGTQQFRNLFDEVPELGQVVSGMFDAADDDGEIDTVSFLMSLEQVPGVQVQMPDPAEAPDEHDDFRLNLRERRRKLQKQREEAQEMQEKQQEIVKDYERAFEGFKERKDLSDDEAEEFKDWFRKTFYGDYERGVLPRDDIFDMAWEHYADEHDDTPIEETEAYQKGYNAAVEEMKQGGASGDGVPNMMSGGGSNDDQPKQSGQQNEVMETLYSEEELSRQGETMHDQF